MVNTQPILIVSTGRTGTIFFSKIFRDLYPQQTASYHERGHSRLIQILTHAHFARLIPKNGVTLAWKLLKGYEVKQCHQDFHIDANSFLYGFAYLAPELYPGLKVIHIIRDPRRFVTSYLNFQLQRKTSFIANHFVPFWQPSPYLTGELSLKASVLMSRFERFCWIWNFKNQVMDRIEKTGTPYMRVRFEDIFHSEQPQKIFGKITDFIGLPRTRNIHDRFQQPANPSIKTKYAGWEHWNDVQCAKLHLICGDRMKQYGYGSEPDWTKRISKIQ